MAFASDVVLPADTSGSILRKDLPLGLIGNFNDQFNQKGLIFGPTQPAIKCGFTFDSDSDGRLFFGPDQNRCGRSNEFPATSGQCPNSPKFQTSQEYADEYFFEPTDASGVWAPNVGQCYDKGDARVTLDKQKELFLKIATDATAQAQWNDPVTGADKPSLYNEFVLKDFGTTDPVSAYVWAHAGPFFNDIRDCPNNGGTYTCELCKLQRELCKGGKLPDKPLIEIANVQYLDVGGCPSNDPSYNLITSYKDVVANGGYDADMIFKELSWDEVCGPGKDVKSGFRPPFRALCKRNGQ